MVKRRRSNRDIVSFPMSGYLIDDFQLIEILPVGSETRDDTEASPAGAQRSSFPCQLAITGQRPFGFVLHPAGAATVAAPEYAL